MSIKSMWFFILGDFFQLLGQSIGANYRLNDFYDHNKTNDQQNYAREYNVHHHLRILAVN